MKAKRFVRIFLITIVIIFIGIFVVRLITTPDKEDVTQFKSMDINLSDKNTAFYYSFIPDGSGIIYVDVVGVYGPNETNWDESKFLFYYLDFKSGSQEKIHEINFSENFHGKTPFIYWLKDNVALLGVQLHMGLCGIENSATVILNLNPREKTPVNCVIGSENGGFPQFYRNYLDHKQAYNIYRVDYAPRFASYVFYSKDNSTYLFSDYLYDGVLNAYVSFAYPGEFNNMPLTPLMVNEEFDTSGYYPKQYNKKIFSRDKQYYFIWKLVSKSLLGDGPSESYLEVYNSNDKMIKKIYLGYSGQTTFPPSYTGYVNFWSNENEIVIIPNVDWNKRGQYKVYFIDLEK
jgi:hypothetical protein